MLRVALAAGIAAVAVLLFSRRRKVSRQFTPRLRSENRGPRRSNSRLLGRPDARGDRFACFLSHFKIQCASEARLLQAELETSLGRRCFLDSDDLKDLRELTEHVRKSEVLVLIQSSGVLKRPWCLLELVTAIDAGIPIVGVALSSGPYAYDFRAAAEFLLALGEPGLLDHDAAVLLEGQGVALDDAARKLSSVIPSMVSIAFDPFASRTVLAATVFDVVEAMNQALSKPPMQLMSAEEWSRTKAKAASALHGKAAAPSAQVLSSMGNRAKCLAILPPEVPNLPETAVSRPEIAALKQLVLEAGGGLAATVTARTPGTAAGSRTAAAAGMGGVGKTMTAAALARDEEVREAFDKICWVSIGQEPDQPALQQTLHIQLTKRPLSDAGRADERVALEELKDAAKKAAVLLVLDDVWAAAAASPLNFVDGSGSSARQSVVVVTTRVRSLFDGAAEVQCGVLSAQASLELLLRAGGCESALAAPPAAAVRAVELCGRLPLALSIAGGIVAELGTTWQSQLVPLLQDELGGEAQSVEERVVTASLRVVPSALRTGVEELFTVFAIFAEDAVVPDTAIDAIAPLIRGSAVAAGGAKQKRHVRQALQQLLKGSLLRGSMDTGVSAHDLVRDCMVRRAETREGGLCALQREATDLLLAAFDASGPATSYVSSSLHWHVRQAQQQGVALHTDALLKRVLTHESGDVRKQGAVGIGVDQLRAAADACDASGLHLHAAELMYAGCAIRNSAAGAEARRAWASLNRLEQAGCGSPASRALESRVLNVLSLATEGGFALGSDRWPQHSLKVAPRSPQQQPFPAVSLGSGQAVSIGSGLITIPWREPIEPLILLSEAEAPPPGCAKVAQIFTCNTQVGRDDWSNAGAISKARGGRWRGPGCEQGGRRVGGQPPHPRADGGVWPRGHRGAPGAALARDGCAGPRALARDGGAFGQRGGGSAGCRHANGLPEPTRVRTRRQPAAAHAS